MAENVNPTAPADNAGTATGADNTGMVPQDKVNRLEAKWRREAEAAAQRASELEAKFAEIESAKKTDIERAIEQARKEAAESTRKELEGTMRQKEIDAELRLRLTQKGLSPDLAYIVKGKAELKSIEDIDDAIVAHIDSQDWLKPRGDTQRHPLQTGAPSPRPAQSGWNNARLAAMVANGQANKITAEDWSEIKRLQREGSWR